MNTDFFDGGAKPLATLGWPSTYHAAINMEKYSLDYNNVCGVATSGIVGLIMKLFPIQITQIECLMMAVCGRNILKKCWIA